ncbi:hypothetical protein ALNOE001_01070 [Candidatus Methanobinarius endosymbioticus]|uniref:Uncharacterized protein n=1 Tax=Candidatus Methanobinarius endosymbioticus TaxID=2006182 RepID=A0A366MFK5_9EURY|nr:hypothetical protein ALNOE001_01070 [Candidatus Methanobinarius endosymbioticus]
MTIKERSHNLSFKSNILELILFCETEEQNQMYFTKYKELFDSDEMGSNYYN